MSTVAPGWSFVVTDALEKVYTDGQPRPLDRTIGQSAFLGETVSIQVAFRPPADGSHPGAEPIRFTVDGPYTRLSTVELVPCTNLAHPERRDDPHFDRTTPGLYPDLLRPSEDGTIVPLAGWWRAVWIDLRVDDAAAAGRHEIVVRAEDFRGTPLFADRVAVEVQPYELPPLDIVNMHWFHCDGLAEFYGVEVFSEPHWQYIDNFLGSAAAMGVTSVLAPVWTPPLDTARGRTRRAVQLVDIRRDAAGYSFGFDKLHRWLQLCQRHGLVQVEIAHLFTQWGAEATPAIYVESDGQLRQAFGWDVPATDPSYRELLQALIPALRAELAQHWSGEVIWHISDEPHGETAPASYQAARAVVADLLAGARVIDALSDIAYFRTGAVPIPVVATDAVGPFLTERPDSFWVYYCVSQQREVANRLIGMPSVRNRVLGHQLFAFEVAGFLHWGFNFYNSALSLRPIDPFADTSAGGGLPSGDPFVVYPGPDGQPWESIRYRVFAAAMWDHRAMQAMRATAGREAVLRIIDPDGTLAFDHYSYDPDHYRRTREEINRHVAAALAD